jgi:hypothetical protein
MNFRTTLIASAIGCLTAISAHADIVTYTGNTLTGPTYDRVDVESTTATPTVVSATGTAVNYNAYSFTVATSGSYSMTTAGAYDTFGTLYAGGFNPVSPLTHAIAGNDDLTGGIGTSGLSFNLTAGTVYTYVNSAFLNGEGGFFSTSITGAGTIAAITIPVAGAPSPRVLTYTGNTTRGPTYDRADTDDNGNVIVSPVGTSVSYQTFSFTVGSVGDYAFIANGDYDTFLSLYAGAFDPANPLANLVDFNDDAYGGAYAGFNSGYLSDISAFDDDLVPGIKYTLVTSGYGNQSGGFFSNAITGPGAITAVPEPGSVALTFLGIGAMSVFARRRQAKRR